jgi:heat shock protein HslJ
MTQILRALSVASILFTTMFGAIITVGCDSQPVWMKQEVEARTDPKSLGGGKWVLVSMNSNGAIPGANLSLEFGANNAVSGFSGVNRFSGTCTTSTGQLKFGALVSTKMAGSPELMKTEQAYLAALASVRNFSLEGGLLRLNNDSGTTVVEFSH